MTNTPDCEKESTSPCNITNKSAEKIAKSWARKNAQNPYYPLNPGFKGDKEDYREELVLEKGND